jgi:hypothetical protein
MGNIFDRLIYGAAKGFLKEADKLIDELVKDEPSKPEKAEPTDVTVCFVSPVSSACCKYGTKGCNLEH